MINEQNLNEWAERFVQQQLSEDELRAVYATLDADPALYRTWKQTVGMLRTFHSGAERKEIKNLISSVAQEYKVQEKAATTGSKVLPFRKHLKTVAAAAGLMLFSASATYLFFNKKDNNADAKQYTLLRREIETIKHSQTKLMDSLKDASVIIEEADRAIYGGTGFAISNEGYVATNYHVVRDANSIYIQTDKGVTKKAYIVAQEPNSDIAILKVEDKAFRFGKSALPYTIAQKVSGLGQKVFTIGYPKDDVVYNEGYISADNGFQGDSGSYQLEITANPGQSGAPVLDKYGNVIGLITGKQSNTAGTTFAVHSSALIDLIRSLPANAHIKLSDANKLSRMDRTEQVKRMRSYVCSVKVN